MYPEHESMRSCHFNMVQLAVRQCENIQVNELEVPLKTDREQPPPSQVDVTQISSLSLLVLV